MTSEEYQRFLLHRGPARVEISLVYTLIGDEDFGSTSEMVSLPPLEIVRAVCDLFNTWPDVVVIGSSVVGPSNPENITEDREQISFSEAEVLEARVIDCNDVAIRMSAVVNSLSTLVGNIDAWRLEGGSEVVLKVISVI
jgi:hypothetical protein